MKEFISDQKVSTAATNNEGAKTNGATREVSAEEKARIEHDARIALGKKISEDGQTTGM